MLELISCKIAFASIKFHFEAIAVIGKGSSSSVFTVKEIPSGRLFASKSILKTYLNKEPFGYVFDYFLFRMHFIKKSLYWISLRLIALCNCIGFMRAKQIII